MMTFFWLVVSVPIVCVSILIGEPIFRKFRYLYNRRKHGCADPPRYAHKDPIFGLDLFLKMGKALKEDRNLPEQMKNYQENGTTFEAVSMGTKTIHTIEPENLRTIYTTNFKDWGVQPSRLPAMEPFCGRGFLTVDGDLWHQSRKMFSPSFEKKAIADFSALERFTQRMMSEIPADGTTFNMQPLLSSLFIDATTLFLFGESFSDLPGSETASDVSKAFDEAMYGSGMRTALGPVRFLGYTKKWIAACRRAQGFAQAYVDKAISYRKDPASPAASSKNNVLLYNLAAQTTDREHLRNEILQAFFVSQGTTAYLVANLLFLVSRRPDVWTKLRAEVFDITGGQAPTYDQVQPQSMPLLRKAINEALRLYPVLAHNARIALSDTILPVGGGTDGKSPIWIQSGTKVNTSYYVLHRWQGFWGEDADEFRIDRQRWSESKADMQTGKEADGGDSKGGAAYAYLPFGAGPRRCVGQEKGLVEASYVMVRLLQSFEKIESRDDKEWKGHVALSAYNANGCQIAFSR